MTRYRYGDEQHLDESLGKIFMFNRVGLLLCWTGFKLCAALQSPHLHFSVNRYGLCLHFVAAVLHVELCCTCYAFVACKEHYNKSIDCYHSKSIDLLPETPLYAICLCCFVAGLGSRLIHAILGNNLCYMLAGSFAMLCWTLLNVSEAVGI